MVSLISTERASGVMAPSLGGGLKRKHTDTDSADEALTAQNKKRRVVAFDPTVNVRILADPNEKSLELVGEEVRRALENHKNGENAKYDILRSLFATKPTAADAPSSATLNKYVVCLSSSVTLLDSTCSGLVNSIVDSSWIARNENYVRSYRTLLRSLLSVHPGYTSSVLNMIVQNLVELPSPHSRHQDDPDVQRSTLNMRLHECLKHLTRHITMASTQLGPIIATTFPFPTESAKVHIAYIKNILRVAGYCPELKGHILSVITDKLVKIDVQIQDNMEEIEDEDRLLDTAASDGDDDISDEDISDDESLEEDDRRIKDLKESVMKLDAIMDILFSFYDSAFANNDSDIELESLMAQFASIILPTYRSRHAQFLLFHFSQTSEENIERFAGCLGQLAFNPASPQILRIAAAAYLASFIARGAKVSKAVARDVFDLLCHQLEALRGHHESTCKAPDLRRYGTYYAVAQALLYMYCFRWRDLIVTEDGIPPSDEEVLYHDGDFTWHGHIQEILHRNIYCKLNPIKIIAPTIVNQFARIAHHLRFLYVFPLMETNKRIRLTRSLGSGYMDGVGARETALTLKKGEESYLLEANFPFDPYVLPRSKRWLESDYVTWKPVPGMKVPADEQEEEEEDDGDDSEEDGEDDEENEGEESDSDIQNEEGDFEEETATESSLR